MPAATRDPNAPGLLDSIPRISKNSSPTPGLLSQMAMRSVMPAANNGSILPLAPLYGSPTMDPAWKGRAQAALNPPPILGLQTR